MKNESTIDLPKASLCPDIWQFAPDETGANEVWQLIPDAYDKLMNIVQCLSVLFSDEVDVHIIGSITSNQYTEHGDIDLHFVDKNCKDSSEDKNLELRRKYEEFINGDGALSSIGSHPIEAYYQENEFQDYMSVGCYDLLHRRWLVGPELTDEKYNPYSDYYREIQKKSENLAKTIRNTIFSIYETAIVIKKNTNTEFKANLTATLKHQLKNAVKLLNNIRNSRKVFSSPTSVEQALKYRSSRKWKIADASFKLFDKYGYIAILRRFSDDYELIEISNEVIDEVVEDILDTVKKYINNADKLSEKEMYEELAEIEQVDEGAKEAVSISLLSMLLAIPNILPAATVRKALNRPAAVEMSTKDKLEQRMAQMRAKAKFIPGTQVDSPMKKVMKEVNKDTAKKVGDYSEANAANIIARTLFAEASGEGEEGMKAVASVIWIRSGKNASQLVNVCKKHSYSAKAKKDIYQFSCWNSSSESSWNPSTYQLKIPEAAKNAGKSQQMWEKAKAIASDLVKGTFSPTVNANMYYNPNIATPEWGEQLTGVKTIGNHKFGTLKNHSKFI